MCGIVGVLRLDNAYPALSVVEDMNSTLVHRGPDDHGLESAGPVMFAHRRLSIIDLEGSRQPMASVDGRWLIVFNGEIFNYRELRQSIDYPFSSEGDTETILAGLVTQGIGFIQKLVGQFAFSAFDRETRTLHLVRDRLGVLPLYYLHRDEALWFGSEIKAILAGAGGDRSVDYESLDAYLYGRSVPAPFTLFAGVRKVRAGHRIEVNTTTGRLKELAYWEPASSDTRTWEVGEAVDAVDAAITNAVRSALVADVPVGAYLSGGVDSSLIVAKAATMHDGGPMKTFSASFGDPRHDESAWARRVSEQFGSDHHEIHVDARDFESLWPTLTWHRDAPMSEPADFAVFRLAEAAREHVRVVLSGEGGDELFGGYPKYRMARAMSALSRFPGGLREATGNSVDQILTQRFNRFRIALRVWSTPDRSEQFRTWFSPFTARERAQLLATVETRQNSFAGKDSKNDVIRAMLLEDVRSWLPDNLLERGDRMSMAASIELRPPLLDHRLVDLAFRLPSNLKVRSGQTKWILKEVARRYLPLEVVDRRKVGFKVPLDSWFRSSLRDSVRDRLTGASSFVAQTFDRRRVNSLLDRHESGVYNEEIRIWTLMSLEVWHETFFRAKLDRSR